MTVRESEFRKCLSDQFLQRRLREQARSDGSSPAGVEDVR